MAACTANSKFSIQLTVNASDARDLQFDRAPHRRATGTPRRAHDFRSHAPFGQRQCVEIREAAVSLIQRRHETADIRIERIRFDWVYIAHVTECYPSGCGRPALLGSIIAETGPPVGAEKNRLHPSVVWPYFDDMGVAVELRP